VKGVDAIKFYGGADRGFRTLLDSFIPAAEQLSQGEFGLHYVSRCVNKLSPSGASIASAAEAARRGAEETRTMKPRAGRSNYLSDEAVRGVPDPGAVASAAALEALAASL
jgi:dihydroxyacetone kinase